MVERRALSALMVASMVMSLAISGCGQEGATGSQTPSPTPSAPREGVPEVISAEAIVVPYREASLSFKVGGRVQQVLVSEGDTVTAGEELAKLDTRDLALAVRRAEARLSSARALLAGAKASAPPEEVTLAEADVSIARGNLASANASLDSAEASLQKAVAGPTQRDIQIAQKQVELARNQLWGAQEQRDVIGAQLKAGAPLASAVEYEAAKAQVAVWESQVTIAELQLEEIKAGAREEDVTVARAQVTQTTSAVQIAEAQLEKARAQLSLALLKAGARAQDVVVAEAAVAEAEVGLSEANNALDDAVLTAPFSGTVGTILLEGGGAVSAQAQAIVLGDLSTLRVRTLDLSEADVSHVTIGQEAVVTIGALGGKQLRGTVVRISPVATERRGDTVYAVTLDLDVGPDSSLRWGMTAYVEIRVP